MRFLKLAAVVAVLAVAAYEAVSLYHFYLGQSRIPLWDMAGHGWGGGELLRALSNGNLLQFLDLLNRQDKWPFGYSLLLLPFLAAGGSTFASATLLSIVFFFLTPLALLWVAWEVEDGPTGLWGGLIAAALFLASPLLRVFGILIMREMAGAFFSLLALGFYVRARRLGTPWAWRLAGLATLALFLIKYNYALVWVLAVLINEVWGMGPERRRELARRIVEILRPWPIRIYVGALIVAMVLGINPGVGVYAGLVIGAVILIVHWRRDPEGMRARWRSLPVEVRAALATVVFPIWVWWLSPSPIHPKNAIAFLRNRSTGPPLYSVESLTFYFQSLMRDYSPMPVLGALVIVFLLIAIVWWRKGNKGYRALFLTAALGLGLATFHPYKEARFLAVAVPFLMLVAALAFSRVAHGYRRVIGGLVCAVALAGIAWTALERTDLQARLARDYKMYSGRPGFWRPLAFLANQARGAERVAVMGTFNELSDDLVRWWLAMDEKTRDIEVVGSPSRRKGLQAWLEEERPDRVLAIRLPPSNRLYQGRDFQRYNAWQLETIAALETEAGWRQVRRRELKALELEILVFQPARAPSPRPP